MAVLISLPAALGQCAAHAAEAIANADPDAAEAMACPQGKEISRRPDEPCPPAPEEIELFGRTARFSAGYEATFESRGNADLDRSRARDRDTVEQEFKLAATVSPSASSTAHFELAAVSELETRRQNGPLESAGELKRGQMWLYLDHPRGFPADLQFGHLSLIEARSWWWDEDLDAVRLIFAGTHWGLDTGLAQRLLPESTAERGIDPEAERLARWFGRVVWVWRERHSLEGFWLVARDHSGRPAPGALLDERREDEVDAHLNWLGVRAVGEERTAGKHRLAYWIDAAQLGGSETRTDFDGIGGNRVIVDKHERKRVSGFGWDLGASWRLPGKARPTVWAGWAVGSGDPDPDDDTDRNFRQTGLEENKGRFGGVKRFRYYGELMRPTLSNLSIRTIGASVRFFKKSSVDLVFHDFRQRQASDRLMDSRLTGDPTGESRALGQEIDIFLAFRESPSTDFTISLSTFRAGSAFGEHSGERAWRLELAMETKWFIAPFR